MAPPSASSRSPDRSSGAARGGRWRAVLRFTGAVMAMSGALLLADVAVTLLWQEPVSAFLAVREQDTLERRLSAETRRFTRSANLRAADRPPARARAARSFGARLRTGDAFGRVAMPTLGQSYVVAEGTDAATLRTSPGHYAGSGLPGLRKTVALAGHLTTDMAPFADVDELESGDPIVLDDAVWALHVPRGEQPDRRAERDLGDAARQRAARTDDVPPAVQRCATNRQVRALDPVRAGRSGPWRRRLSGRIRRPPNVSEPTSADCGQRRGRDGHTDRMMTPATATATLST